MSYYHQTWHIKTTKVPKIRKHCSKCGEDTAFVNSYKFRVNANGKNLDIWMIFNCIHCKTSYNLSLYERIKPSTLDNDVLEAFMQNDANKIEAVAVEGNFYSKNKVHFFYDDDAYCIEGICTEKPLQNTCIEVQMNHEVPLRIDRFLCNTLKYTRSALKQKIEKGEIQLDYGLKPNKHSIRHGMKIYVNSHH